jgi:hypothetical protein
MQKDGLFIPFKDGVNGFVGIPVLLQYFANTPFIQGFPHQSLISFIFKLHIPNFDTSYLTFLT